MRLPFALIATFALCCGLAAQDKPAGQPIASFIPAAPFKASLMRLAFDKQAGDISRRFNEAILASPEWFQAYMADNAGVKPLPYHRNFGISEAEYSAMLKSFESRRLEKVKDVAVIVRRAADGSIRLDCPELGRAFQGIAVDSVTGRLSTPVLDIEKPDCKNSGSASDGNPFGDWQGVSWKGSESNPEKGVFKSVSFIAGRKSGGGASFIAYRIKEMEANRIKGNFESILQFELPAGK